MFAFRKKKHIGKIIITTIHRTHSKSKSSVFKTSQIVCAIITNDDYVLACNSMKCRMRVKKHQPLLYDLIEREKIERRMIVPRMKKKNNNETKHKKDTEQNVFYDRMKSSKKNQPNRKEKNERRKKMRAFPFGSDISNEVNCTSDKNF